MNRSSLRAMMAVLLLLTGGACSSQPARAPTGGSAAPSGAPMLVAVLAAHTCGALGDRFFALPAGADGIVTSYAKVKQCSATAEGDVLLLQIAAYAWLATDRDIAGVQIRQFVHATVDVAIRLRPIVRYVDGHLELALGTSGPPRIAIEPVGALDVAPLNWASWAAEQLAPSAGTTAEWLAKGAVRDEAGAALRDLTASGAVIAFDARRDVTWLVPGKPPPIADAATARARVLVVPAGSAWLGPFTPARAARVRVHLERGESVAVKPMCRDYAETLLDADRRGAVVHTEDWAAFGRDTERMLDLPSCPWVLALRTLGAEPVVASVESESREPTIAARSPGTRWVALDEIAVDTASVAPGVEVWLTSDLLRVRVHPPSHAATAILTELAAGDAIVVRALDPAASPPKSLGSARLDLDARGDSTATLEARAGGAVVRVRARLRGAPSTP